MSEIWISSYREAGPQTAPVILLLHGFPTWVSCPARAEFYANGFSLVITKTSQPRNYQWINGLENLSDHVVGHMCHVIHTEQATSVRSSPRPWERPEAAWSNISHTGGKRPKNFAKATGKRTLAGAG